MSKLLAATTTKSSKIVEMVVESSLVDVVFWGVFPGRVGVASWIEQTFQPEICWISSSACFFVGFMGVMGFGLLENLEEYPILVVWSVCSTQSNGGFP